MPLFEGKEEVFAEKAAALGRTNPFDPVWMEGLWDTLDQPRQHARTVIAWSPGWGPWGPDERVPFVLDLEARIAELVERVRARLVKGLAATDRERAIYEILALYSLYGKHGKQLDRYIDAAVRGQSHQSRESAVRRQDGPPPDLKSLWEEFRLDHAALLHLKGYNFPLQFKPEHVFAIFFLFRRAFYYIFFNIVGSSKAVSRLRTAVWESIVTHDFLDWSRSLYERMSDFPTLITGASGTGKELVAQAIGQSLYIPFDPKAKVFATDFLSTFQPVNLSALSPPLIESELFGHVKGAFTDAVEKRTGRLADCSNNGAVFLDEIGELTGEIQVKLLRVLQTRRFQAVGANEDKEFRGKIIAATNRDLAVEMQARRFREDFYYRLCADRITTPSLREQLEDRPEDLPEMVEFVCRRVVGEDKAAGFAREVVGWIGEHLRRYSWPGNFRELEQCVRSYTIRKQYHPLQPARTPADEGPLRPPGDPVAEACATLARAVVNKETAYDEIERRLFILVRGGTRTDKEAAALLGRDYRTLQGRLKAIDRRPADD